MYSLIIGLLILAGLGTAFINGRKILKSNKTKNWPHTNATLSHKPGRTDKDAPEIFYHYQVNEKSYHKQIHPSTGEETMPGFAAHFRKKYPDGENITVYYESDSPENTLFTAGAVIEDKLIFWMGIGTIFLGMYGLTV